MKKPWRKNIRLAGYDYSEEGAYFITMCTKNRRKLFGEITEGKVILNQAGRLALDTWQELTQHFENISLDEFIIMPDHIHGIIFIHKNHPLVRPSLVDEIKTKEKTLGDIVGAYKSLVTNKYIEKVKTKELPKFNKSIWTPNYYEHIIRNTLALRNIRAYIKNNPRNHTPSG